MEATQRSNYADNLQLMLLNICLVMYFKDINTQYHAQPNSTFSMNVCFMSVITLDMVDKTIFNDDTLPTAYALK